MCFDTSNADWCAEVEKIEGVRGCASERKCAECWRIIRRDEWRLHVHQQEEEMCQLCEDSDSPEFRGDESYWDAKEEFDAYMAECEHDYGESLDADICRECCLLLAAIYDLEAKEGCPEWSRQPLFGELSEEISNSTYRGESPYIKHALEMFPELATHSLCV